MAHIGAICPPYPGHLHANAALGRELKKRGHRVTMFGIPDVEEKICSEGLDYWSIGRLEYPPGTLPGIRSRINQVQWGIREDRRRSTMICQEAPEAFKNSGIQLLLANQMEPAAATVAEFLQLPFVTVIDGLLQNREASVPPTFTPWDYQNTWRSRQRNRFAYYMAGWVTRPIQARINQYRKSWSLPLLRGFDDSFSPLAQISQQPPAFDFPREALPPCFHYVGPFRRFSPEVVPFPYEKLTGQPLIYASLGTLYNRRPEIFHCIAAACQALETQLIISLGGGSCVEEYSNLPGAPLVVEYAPQIDLLAKAKMTINHGGQNTVLEALSFGVPSVAIPITDEHPGTGARLRWTGAGEVVPLKELSVTSLQAAVQKVWHEESYYQNAAKLQASIRSAGGVSRAADIVERVLATGKPALAQDIGQHLFNPVVKEIDAT